MHEPIKHTAGPWKADLSDDRSAVLSSSGQLIAAVDTWMDEEKEANVRLLAAAPDLLAALEALLKERDEAGSTRCYCNFERAYTCPPCSARAAIAKANGQQPQEQS